MRDSILPWPIRRIFPLIYGRAAVLAVLAALAVPRGFALADEPPAAPAAESECQMDDPFGVIETADDPFETVLSDSPVDAGSYVPTRSRWENNQTNYQGPVVGTPDQHGAEELPKGSAVTLQDPCSAARFKPLGELGIGIGQPNGPSPTDFATPCWDQINSSGPYVGRCWPTFTYQWDSTCLCYQPLYFEEVNAERYGYICNDYCGCCCSPQNCLQSACSAAHFFGTVPCLPYCLVAECPTECVYTLGHYRPGTCGVPWQRNYPSCKPVAAAGTAGIYTGLIFAIP